MKNEIFVEENGVSMRIIENKDSNHSINGTMMVYVTAVESGVQEIVFPEKTTIGVVGYDGNDKIDGKVYPSVKKIYVPKNMRYLKLYNLATPNIKDVQIADGNTYMHKTGRSLIGMALLENALINVLPGGEPEYVVPKEVKKIRNYAFTGSGVERITMDGGRNVCFCKFSENAFTGSKIEEEINKNGYFIIDNTILIYSAKIKRLECSHTLNSVVFHFEDTGPKKIRIKELVFDGETGLDSIFSLNKFDWAEIEKVVLKIKPSYHVISKISILQTKGIVVENSDKYVVEDNILYNKEKTELLFCPRIIEKDVVLVPEGVLHIATMAFSYNKTVKKVVCPKSLANIGDSAFAYSNIEEIELPDIIETIGGVSCARNLRHFKMPENVRSLEDYCFYETALEKIEIPEGVEHIGNYALKTNEKEKGMIVTLPSTLRFLNKSSLSGVSVVTLKSNVRNLLLSFGSDAETKTIISRSGRPYIFFPDEIDTSYKRYLNDCWNTGRESIFIEAYRNIPDNLDSRRSDILKIGFWLFNYIYRTEDFKESKEYLREHSMEVFDFVVKYINKGDISQDVLIKLVKDDIFDKDALVSILEYAMRKENVVLMAYVAEKINKNGNAKNEDFKI